MPDQLTEKQREYGKKQYIKFTIFNGISVAAVAESFLILFALKLSIPDYIVGVISSFFYLGLLFTLLGRQLIIRHGIAKTITIAWLIRAFSGIITLITPVIIYYLGIKIGIVWFIFGAFMFYSGRGTGMVGLLPIVGELTNENDIADFNAKSFSSFNIAYFLTIFALIFVFELSDQVSTFQIILLMGCIAGLFSAKRMSKIPETKHTRISAAVPLKNSAKAVFNNPHSRNVLFLQTFFFIITALVVPYSMIALKKSYNISDYKAFEFVLAQFLGGIIIAKISKKSIKKLGHNTFLNFMMLIIIISTIFWIEAPLKFYWIYFGILFFILGFAQTGGYLCLAQKFLLITDRDSRIGFSVIISGLSSLIAGIAGALIGGGILDYYNSKHVLFITSFHYYFTIMSIVAISFFFASLFFCSNIKNKQIPVTKKA